MRWYLVFAGAAISVAVIMYLRDNDLTSLKIIEFHYWEKQGEIQQQIVKALFGFHQRLPPPPLKLDFVWGLKGIDNSEVNDFDVTDLGQPLWDSDFDISSPES